MLCFSESFFLRKSGILRSKLLTSFRRFVNASFTNPIAQLPALLISFSLATRANLTSTIIKFIAHNIL
jgi:hypothetical protein